MIKNVKAISCLDCFHTKLKIDSIFFEALEEKKEKAKKQTQNKDAILIYTYLQLKRIFKNSIYLKLTCKDEYAKNLYKQIKASF